MSASRKTPSRKVLITGAAGALGQVVTERFRKAGDAIVATTSPGKSPAAIPGVEWLAVDLVDGPAVLRALGAREFDVVVHCAGGFRWSLVEALSAADFRFLVATNFESAFHVAQATVPAMKRNKSGVLLFVSSIATQSPAAGMSAYAATKGAVNAFATNLAAELRADGVRVNAILPSIIDTPANRRDMPNADFSSWIPREELADRLFELASESSASVTGALLPIPGRG